MTYNPASFIRSHVTVHLHTLAGVPVNVNGVDPAERLSIQQVLGTILGCCKKATPWKRKKAAVEAWNWADFVIFVQFVAFGSFHGSDFFSRSSTIDGVAWDNVLLVVTNPQKAR